MLNLRGPVQGWLRGLPGVGGIGSLALMETRCWGIFGSALVLNDDTFTAAIYKPWFGLSNLQAAPQLASRLLLVVISLVCGELYLRSRARYHDNGLSPAAVSAMRQRSYCRMWFMDSGFLASPCCSTGRSTGIAQQGAGLVAGLLRLLPGGSLRAAIYISNWAFRVLGKRDYGQ